MDLLLVAVVRMDLLFVVLLKVGSGQPSEAAGARDGEIPWVVSEFDWVEDL